MPRTIQGSRAMAEQDYRVYFMEDLVLAFERSRQSESKSSVSAASLSSLVVFSITHRCRKSSPYRTEP